MPVTFPDPRRAVRDYLRSVLPGRPEACADGLTAANISVKGQPAETLPTPYLQVNSDGRFRDARLNGRATVRVLVWHADEGLGEELAALAEALLLDGAATDALRGCSPLIGTMPVGDPDTHMPMSYFSVTARLRPINL